MAATFGAAIARALADGNEMDVAEGPGGKAEEAGRPSAPLLACFRRAQCQASGAPWRRRLNCPPARLAEIAPAGGGLPRRSLAGWRLAQGGWSVSAIALLQQGGRSPRLRVMLPLAKAGAQGLGG
ncbi:hypothetical protein LNQ03_08365 [Klebsiella pneumoniae subsp. pneumoniae]|nr:hypothetical protein [Klebsiella pneumoniae subsp. pneumoniae]